MLPRHPCAEMWSVLHPCSGIRRGLLLFPHVLDHDARPVAQRRSARPVLATLAHLCAEERVHGSERLRAGERRFHSGEDLKIGAHLRIASRCLPAPQRQRGYFLQTVASFGFTLLAKFSASPRYSNCRRGKVLLPRADFICSGSRMSTSILPFAQYTV